MKQPTIKLFFFLSLSKRPTDSLLQQQQQQSGSASDKDSHYFYQSFSSSSPLARTYSSNQNAAGLQDNNIPQIGPDLGKDELSAGDMFVRNQNAKMLEDRNLPKNVTAQAGHTVYMHCIVELIGDKMVSSLT